MNSHRYAENSTESHHHYAKSSSSVPLQKGIGQAADAWEIGN
jgi:hypothetical protein